MTAKRIEATWDQHCIVAASGPSLTPNVVHRIRFARLYDQWRVIAVNDVYKVMPWADAMYAVDNGWWRIHKECPGFRGIKWAGHDPDPDAGNDKREFEQYGVNMINGKAGFTFSNDPSVIHYGMNSGFQAINLALLHGATYIVLVGFDMRHVGAKAHFFGDHPQGLCTSPDHVYRSHAKTYEQAAKKLPAGVRIVNATPGSALTCFPMMELGAAIDRKEIDRHRLPDRDRAIAHA